MLLQERILSCKNCNLYQNQLPLLDNIETADIMWIGLSAKNVENKEKEPLAKDTNTGMIIQKMMNKYSELKYYKTNLVKCVPLNSNGKIRYPNKNEINQCINYIQKEIDIIKPQIVFLLGLNVANAICKYFKLPLLHWNEYNYDYVKYNEIYFVTIQHPSYINTYKKDDIVKYINGVSNVIEKICVKK